MVGFTGALSSAHPEFRTLPEGRRAHGKDPEKEIKQEAWVIRFCFLLGG